MTDTLKSSWGAFSADVASRYLKSFGHPSTLSKVLMCDVLKSLAPKSIKLIDLGCGNANLAEFLLQNGLKFSYCGVDFSESLLDAARQAFPAGEYICDDVNKLENVSDGFDVACYSHVIEMLPSPESSLKAARRIANKIVIRFFEPPADRDDWVELLEMDVGGKTKVPYLRRKMSQDNYQLILAKLGCTRVDLYRTADKDQVHVLHF